MMQGMKRGKEANIWDVVSSLARALANARDQLVGLINFDGSGKGCDRCRGKENVPRSNIGDVNNELAMRLRGGAIRGKQHVPDSRKAHSVHRQHARGHFTFGNHSEFKPEPPSKSGKHETMAANICAARAGSRPGSGKGRGVQLYLDPKSNSLQINSNRGGCKSPVSIFVPKSPCPREYSCKSPCGMESRACSPYVSKRHCIGTQFAALLREEACQARERRLTKKCERMNAKPRWACC